MTDCSQQLQRIVDAHYEVYRERVVEPLLEQLRALEHALLQQTLNSGVRRSEELHTVVRTLYLCRNVERNVIVRRRVVERLTLDGPGDWLI